MVSKEKFPDDVDYDAVFLQPARLASNLLVTRQAVHYFLAIIHAAPRRGDERSQEHRYHDLKHILDLQPSDYVEVARKLEQAAETLTWVVEDIANCAETEKKPSDSSGRTALSARSQIAISKEFYEALLHAQDGDRKLGLQFNLALTLAHELAHATLYALTEIWWHGGEPSFGYAGSDDAGWELEARLFGLRAHEEEKLSGELWWYKLVASQDKQSQLTQSPVERVSIEFIQELFTDGFWSDLCSTENPLKIVPSAARSLTACVPESIRALILSARRSNPSIPTAETEAEVRSSKRENSDDDVDDNTGDDRG